MRITTMLVAYFDCFSGISGDMILGALLDAGLSRKTLEEALRCLPLSDYRITVTTEARHGVRGTRFVVHLDRPEPRERSYRDITQLLSAAALPPAVKTQSLAVFHCLAQAEAHIHQKTIDEVHFHEVGAVDSLIDIVGAVAGIHSLGVEHIIASPLPLGSGFVHCRHGTLPVPAPATVEILRDVPVYGGTLPGELVTPTGAAFLRTLAQAFGPLPSLRITTVGYGVGTHDRIEAPNLLRLILGEDDHSALRERLEVIETTIDDMNPQWYDHLIELLYTQGALDVILVPVQMKKNRPGTMLKVTAQEAAKQRLLQVLFRETTTIGIRSYPVERVKLARRAETVATPWGDVRVKVIERPEGLVETVPEYEDCKRIAREHKIPLKQVYQEIARLIRP
jgi:uncharacterized protein (TIGR00299 family) protein